MKMRDWMKTAECRAKEVNWTKTRPATSRKPRHKNMSAMQDLQVYCNTRQEVNVENEKVTMVARERTVQKCGCHAREFSGINELN